MEEFADNRVNQITVKCSAQSSKTQTILNLVCWCVSEDPGPAMWVMASKDDAKDFFKDRVSSTFDNCPPVQEQFVEAEGTTYRFVSMPLYFVGAGSPSKLQGKPVRWLFLDEVRNYPPGRGNGVRSIRLTFERVARRTKLRIPCAAAVSCTTRPPPQSPLEPKIGNRVRFTTRYHGPDPSIRSALEPPDDLSNGQI
jgi:phage terminase large subunit GpA-like protein